jgi:predicted DsbA family dithiol-disulfide isomerase
MRIIYLNDFNCPYSYIGLNRVKNAVCELNLDVEWEMKSFELEPNARNFSAADRFAFKNGLSCEDAKKEIDEMEKIAQNDGLQINYQNLIINSSKDAHRMAKYVQNNYPELSQELIFKIFESNFTKNEDISNHDVLISIVASCGLDEDEMGQMLKGGSLKIEVELDMDEAISNGITTTPYYFIEHNDERLLIPGVFEKESFKIAFEDLINGEMNRKTFI